MTTEIVKVLNKEDFEYFFRKFFVRDTQVVKEKAPDAHAWHWESFYIMFGDLKLTLKARIPNT